MNIFWSALAAHLHSPPTPLHSPTYLEMRRGKLPLCAGFHCSYNGSMEQPSLLIDEKTSEQYFSLGSASIPTQFDLRWMVEQQFSQSEATGTLFDEITNLKVKAASLKLLSSPANLARVETELTELSEMARIDTHTFSQNGLTNANTYDFVGNIISLEAINIDAASKRYMEEDEVLERAPHPVRHLKRKKKQEEGSFRKKTERQILEEFNILNKMLTLNIESSEEIPYSQILEVVELSDGQNYSDLWTQLSSELSLKDNKEVKNLKITETMSDEQFETVINRIMKEATEYEQELAEKQDQQEQAEPETESIPSTVPPSAPLTVPLNVPPTSETPFESIRIEKKTTMQSNKFANAVEDSSDLTNFYDTLPKESFAVQYPFELDEFQKRSILHLQRKESVFVAAHTSAGKTVIAEYGIALALKHKRKVIYTSPIKALSNQKYRELSSKFDSVGIVTGDVSLNPLASCVIMTTEILRNNLYRGAEMIRDIEWVIFDEIHYINNQERGVVWQETIIMLPEHIGLIMLSATVPNYMEFANWVGRTKRRVIYVMKTLHRPVPLQHSLFIFNKFHVIKEANGGFLREQYNELKDQINGVEHSAELKKEQLRENKRKKIQEKGFYNDCRREQAIKLLNKHAVDKFIKKITRTDMETAEGREEFRVLQELVADCQKKNLLPCVVFTFSKKKINELAGKIYTFDLTTGSEKSKIRRLISHALSTLKPEDRELQQFDFLSQICMHGYAVHHGDLLPLAKEIVELLFSQGLIKVLFATETFAMGINMPAKTVIFNSIRKVQGSNGGMRFLNSSEYVQMSGRAGRRGLDEKGTVIIMVKDPSNLPEVEEMVKMIDHPGERLESKFKVTYQIILNLFTSKDINVQEMMRQSFLEDPKFKEFTSNLRHIKELKKNYETLSEFECPFNKLGTRILMESYIETAETIRSIPVFYDWKKVGLPRYGLLLGTNLQLQVCLILRVNGENKGRCMQVMVVHKMYLEMEITKEERLRDEKRLNIKKHVVLEYERDQIKPVNGQVMGTNNEYHYYIYWVRMGEIAQIYSNKVAYRNQLDDSKQCLSQIAAELLNPPKVLTPFSFGEAQDVRKGQLNQLIKSQCHDCDRKDEHLHQYNKRNETKLCISESAKKINTNELGLMGSFQGMLATLQEFGFIQDGALTLKGRIARQVDIYVAQIVVEAVLDPLNPAEIAALLSAFVCDYKPRQKRGQQSVPLSIFGSFETYTKALDHALSKTHDIVRKMVAQELKNQAYLNPLTDQELIITLVNFNLCDTVHKWAMGFDFAEAMMDTEAPEGTVVKTIMRLNMLLGNIKNVCRLMGSSELEIKIDEAIESIRRDIVFCQSLYLTA